ncbi:MAG: hypothetical protein HY979_01055 [Candidatus Magasanikbacteria bacterium]|nr:hypothetical protein [Candidatus Magasanikbacteria bacterium]
MGKVHEKQLIFSDFDNGMPPNQDIQHMPTPEALDKRDSAHRVEVNARSLFMLCSDLPVFMDKAEKESLKDVSERDQEAVENINLYFVRLRSLLTRIKEDFRGNEYTGGNVRPPLEKKEVSVETQKYLKDSLDLVNECLGGADRQNLFPTRSLENFSDQETDQILPFRRWLSRVEEAANFLRNNLFGQ